MIQKHFDEISKADIDSLIENRITESKTLEYKEKWPGDTDRDKKEFLADISSFANASGGDLIYGISAALDDGKKNGEPKEVVPLEGMTADEAKLQIENLVRDGIKPRMPIHVKEIGGYGDDGNGFVILVRIPQSFASPHMVTLKKHSRFYCRNSAGKYQLDVQEIRSAFLATDSQADRIRRFFQDRIAKIMADETPVELSMPHRLVLHIVPLNAFLNQKRLDFGADRDVTAHFRPIGGKGYNNRYNLDGLLTYQCCGEAKPCDSYCQTFFDGTIEAVSADILGSSIHQRFRSGDDVFIALINEKRVINAISKYFKGYEALGVDAPVVISMALLGCKGVYMYADAAIDSHPIDRDVAILPNVQTGSLDEEVPTIMKPIFDAVWNACGHPRSYNYDADGNWIVR